MPGDDRPVPDDGPVPGEVVSSRRDDVPLLGGAPRRDMVRLLVLAGVLALAVPLLISAVADAPAWAYLRVAFGIGAFVFTVGWQVLRAMHRRGRLR